MKAVVWGRLSAWGTVLASLLVVSSVLGGGPRTIGFNGQVFKWDANDPSTFPVRLVVDNGPLGASISRDEGAQLIRDALRQWSDIPTSSIRFLDTGFLEMDLTVQNYRAFFENQSGLENPVIFDLDGRIVEDVLGAGARHSVLGFAGERSLDFNSGAYRTAWIVLNGRLAKQDASFASVVAHEVGHLIGLDHSQINEDLAFNGISTDNSLIPLMYPFSLSGGPEGPIRDDIAWASWLYPEPGFLETTGAILGRVSRRTGGPFQGANVVAVKVEQAGSESRTQRVSVVSDFRIKGDGAYELPGLPPGQYAVFIEPLNPLFVRGSGVGPFDHRFDDFERDYFNAEAESGRESDDPTERVLVTVGSGKALGGIDFVANEPLRPLSQLGDDDAVLYELPEGFSFPFFGRLYDQVFVNSDGNLTFERGEGIVAGRNEARFLGGPPRIAPLFTDLDPSQLGEVVVSTQPESVKFTWNGIPEFAVGKLPPANNFSVTLFAGGAIEFSYQAVEVTPDGDGVQAVVGVSPGDRTSGDGLDLSMQSSALSVGIDPLYEVFTETSFDLAGQDLRFQADSNPLYFPFYRGDAQIFSGYAITNLSAGDAAIQVEGLGVDGTLLPLPGQSPNAANPSFAEISSQGQLARIGRQLFGIDLSVAQQGWIRMSSNTPQLGSFFQVGGDLSGPVTRLDGSLAFTSQSDVLYFTRLFDGPSTFPTFGAAGAQDAQTTLHIANPNDEEIVLTFNLFANTGLPVAGEVTRTLPPSGSLAERVQTLFNIFTPIRDGFIRVDVEGPGAVGFALIEVQDNLIGLNAVFPSLAETLYSAQLATGVQGAAAVFTSLKLVNTNVAPRLVTVTAFRDDGAIITVVPPFVLSSNNTFQRELGELLLQASPANSPLTSGSIRVEVDGPGVIGDVVFGDPGDPNTGIPDQIDFLAGIPLQTQLLTGAVFSQVANGAVEPEDPSTDTFTGITIHNPSDQVAQLRVRVFNSAGQLVGETADLSLGAGQRLSRLIEDLLPETGMLLGGYIVLESDQGIVAQVFFGNSTLQFLSAVPPVSF